MKRYFFNIVDAQGEIADTEGTLLPDMEAVREEALMSARELVAERIKYGSVIRDSKFRVTDDSGAVVLIFPFKKVGY